MSKNRMDEAKSIDGKANLSDAAFIGTKDVNFPKRVLTEIKVGRKKPKENSGENIFIFKARNLHKGQTVFMAIAVTVGKDV